MTFIFTDLWKNYLPFLYSCISFIGVLMLLRNYNFEITYLPRYIILCKCLIFFYLVCTPVGFATLFTVLSRFMIKPQLQKTTDEEISILKLEVDYIARRYTLLF